MIYRQLIEDLEKWSQRPNRKPLVLRGARQVGKTTLIDEFGKLQFIGLIGGRILTWGRRVPEAAEKSPDVGRRYRCKYLRISLKFSNFTSNSNTL